LGIPSGPRQAFSTPTAEGQRNSKKICRWAAAVVASSVPAVRAARIDVMKALRAE
jgi:hypothetical protein